MSSDEGLISTGSSAAVGPTGMPLAGALSSTTAGLELAPQGPVRPLVQGAPLEVADARPSAPHAPARTPAPAPNWWHAGVYCGAPAVFLWIVARLPADMLAQLFRGPSMPVVLNQLGDALFVCGWAISAILLWGSRRRRPR